MRSFSAAVLVALVVVLTVSVAPAGAASTLRMCGKTGIQGGDDLVFVAARGIGCRRAKRIALDWLRGDRRPQGPHGWRCTANTRVYRCSRNGALLRLTLPCFGECEGIGAGRTVASIAGAASPDPSAPSTAPRLPNGRRCGRSANTTFGAIYASDVEVRRISCSAAKRVLTRVKIGQFRPTGWRCKTVGEIYEGTTLRCYRKRMAMQFNAGV